MGKKRQQDFQKVKLKVGKKLKKGDNVTNASFRSRTVQVSQQLKTADTSEPSTRKKQNITELLSQCRHYSASVRHEALTGLRELMTSHPGMMTSHLASVLERTAELFMDKDPNVRQAVIRLFRLMLPNCPETAISPFFPLLCAHLCCAMTHIYDDIQVDSLSVLDMLLDTYPSLLVQQSNQVLSNFIEQISRGQGHAKGSRSLATNPNSKTSSQKWRAAVLTRLHKVLSAIIGTKTGEAVSGLVENAQSKEFHWVDGVCNRVQVFPSHFTRRWNQPGLVLRSVGSSQQEEAGVAGQLHTFMATIVPLLLECWLEVSPAQETNTGHILHAENVGLVSSTLSVAKVLMDCVEQMSAEERADVPCRNYMQDFEHHFMSGFPYSIHTPAQKMGKKQKSKETEQQVPEETINLAVCDIMTHFLSEVASQSSAKELSWLPLVTQYLRDFLGGKYGTDVIGQNAKQVVKIVQRLIACRIEQEKLSDLISQALRRYLSCHYLSTEKRVYLQFFTDLILQSSHSHVISEDQEETFLCSLPELLAPAAKDSHQMAVLLISVMKKGVGQKCEKLMVAMETLYRDWFEPESGVILHLDKRGQRDLIGLLYGMRRLDETLLKALVRFSRDQAVDAEHVLFLLSVLHNRMMTKMTDVESAADQLLPHLKFLLTLLLGITSEELKALQTASHDQSCDVSAEVENTSGITLGGYKIVVSIDDATWNRHRQNIKAVVGTMKQFPDVELLWETMSSFLEKFLKQNSSVPVQTVCGICELITALPASIFESTATVTPPVINLCLSLVQRALLQDSLANQNGDNMWKQLCAIGCGVLKTLPDGILKSFTALVNNINDGELSRVHVAMASEFLRDETNRQQFSRESYIIARSLVHNLLEKTKTQFTDGDEPLWLTEFKYAIAVLEI